MKVITFISEKYSELNKLYSSPLLQSELQMVDCSKQDIVEKFLELSKNSDRVSEKGNSELVFTKSDLISRRIIDFLVESNTKYKNVACSYRNFDKEGAMSNLRINLNITLPILKIATESLCFICGH